MQYGVLTVRCNIPYNNIENKNYTIIESRVKLMANVSIRMDDALKKQAEELFNDLGMNLTTAFTDCRSTGRDEKGRKNTLCRTE